jgi:hypothetical protein
MTENQIAPLTEGDIVPAGTGFANTADASAAIGTLMQHAQAMEAAYQLGSRMANTSLVPQMYQKKPDDATAAILYGAELGLNPIQSLQQIFVVQGKPAIYARTMVALLKTRGYLIETVESTDESVTVRGTDPHTGSIEESTWTYERAKKAGYTSNKKYDTDPQAMLHAKASTEVCRKLAPDVLLGIAHSREELEMEPIKATAERVPTTARGVAGVAAALSVGTASESGAKPEPEQVSASDPAEKVDTPAEPKPATTADLRKLDAALTNAGITNQDERRSFLSTRVGRELAAAKDLTRDEIASIVRFVETGEEPVQ